MYESPSAQWFRRRTKLRRFLLCSFLLYITLKDLLQVSGSWNPFTLGLCCKCEKSHRHITCGSFILMCPKGFEPPTHGLEGRCSIQLSYGHIFIKITEVLCNRSVINSPSRARTYNNSVNSRVLYHWAIEDYVLVGFVYFVFSQPTSLL